MPRRPRGGGPAHVGEQQRLNRGAPSRASNLRERARCLRAIRAFFDDDGYIEVSTPALVRHPGLEPHLIPIPCGVSGANGSAAGPPRYLITSPEYHMKRLLAGGLERIYYLGPCWRAEEQGPHHLEEFCMLEWYQAHATLQQLMEQTEALLEHLALQIRGTTSTIYQGRPLVLGRPFERVSFAEALELHAGMQVRGVVQREELLERALAAGFGPFDPDEGFDAIVSRVLVERVEPALAGSRRPVFLYDFPAPLAALARLRPEDPGVAERFELYAGGVELANAFGELTDAAEQRRRLEHDRARRAALGRDAFDLDEQFLAALEQGMPPAAGIALGVDRLVALLLDAPSVQDVVAFHGDEI